MAIHPSLLKGIGCGVAAGMCWGVIFLGPALTPDLSGTEFAVLRFLCYGLISLLLIAPRWRRLRPLLSREDWRALLGLSLVGNLFYYSMVGTAVQYVGVATTSLIVGLIPVLVTLAGRRDHNAVPLARLLPSLCCATLGVALISLNALGGQAVTNGPLGLACAFAALLSWSGYAVSNARHLARTYVSAHDWTLLTGVVTGALSLLALPLLGPRLATLPAPVLGHGLLVTGGLALLASVIGGAFWNQASRLLPLALSGQVLVIETLTALLLGFLWEQRLPSAVECSAMVLLVVGVAWCLRCHQPAEPRPATQG